MPPKNIDPELYGKLAVAKNRLLNIKQQISALKEQEKKESEALQQICPHTMILEYWEWHSELKCYDRIISGIRCVSTGLFTTYYAQRVCCICGEKDLLAFDLNEEQVAERKTPPPIPENMQFARLTAEPTIKIPPQKRIDYDVALEGLSVLTLHELLKKIEEKK